MGNTVGKVLVVVITVSSLIFFGIAGASQVLMSDLKADAALAKEKRTEAEAELAKVQALRPTPAELDARRQDAEKARIADTAALHKRRDQLAAQLAGMNNLIIEQTDQLNAATQKVQQVRDVGKLRREEIVQLHNQLATLRAQRGAAENEVRRLKDLLVQAQGTLERAELRRKLLESDGAKLPYEEPAADAPAAPAEAAPAAENPDTDKSEAAPAADAEKAPEEN